MISKSGLERAVQAHKEVTKEALQLVYDNVNKGQRKKIAKDPEVKALFDRYGVEYET